MDKSAKECGECTFCCEGTLTIKVNEHKVYPGHPCPHVSEHGCGIYNELSRPGICDHYKCAWLKHWTLPDWMRPDKVGFLMTVHKDYVTLTGDFNGGSIDGVALLCAIEWCKKRDKTVFYTVKSNHTDDSYFRGSIMNHPESVFKSGTRDEIFEPVEVFNDG